MDQQGTLERFVSAMRAGGVEPEAQISMLEEYVDVGSFVPWIRTLEIEPP